MRDNSFDNRLILIEGIDGTGKTTACSQVVRALNAKLSRKIQLTLNDSSLLRKRLHGKLSSEAEERFISELYYGKSVLFSDIPVTNPYSSIKRLVEDGSHIDVQFFHFLASSLFKNQVIEALLPYVNLVMDRGIFSVLAHHEANGAKINSLDLSNFDILRPDMYFLLVCDEGERRRRLEDRGKLDKKDQRVKIPGSELEIVESVFKRYSPYTIDTTSLTASQVRDRILGLLAEHEKSCKPCCGTADSNAFDTSKYIEFQRKGIRDKLSLAPSNATIFVEFGGKPIDDKHAARVLPGFDPDCKLQLLSEFPDFSRVMVVNFRDITRPRIRGDSSLFYDSEIRRLVDKLKNRGITIDHVCISLVPDEISHMDESKLVALETLITQEYSIPTSRLGFIPGYPDLSSLDDMNSFLQRNPPIFPDFGKNMLVFSPGGGSGKFGLCLGQMAQTITSGRDVYYLKYETFPAYGLPPDHPVNRAFVAATADLGNQVLDGSTMTTYDKDVENFRLLQLLIRKFPNICSDSHPLLQYIEPSEIGVNRTHQGIMDHDIVKNAAETEILRRRLRYAREYREGIETEDTLRKVGL